jgi:hypothetical protein
MRSFYMLLIVYWPDICSILVYNMPVFDTLYAGHVYIEHLIKESSWPCQIFLEKFTFSCVGWLTSSPLTVSLESFVAQNVVKYLSSYVEVFLVNLSKFSLAAVHTSEQILLVPWQGKILKEQIKFVKKRLPVGTGP